MQPLWKRQRVVVCAGTGGVGKTTVSAALGLAAAAAGKRTLVMTIDPARRLADALGLASLDHRPHPVDAAALEKVGVTLQAPVWAMMPDVHAVYDGLIRRLATSQESCDRILGNRLYRHFTDAVAGSHEYAAVEAFYDVYHSDSYDFIVLDTPPSQNMLDFVDAPSRMMDFFDHDVVRWLVKPYAMAGRWSLRLLDVGTSLVVKTLGRLAGAEILRDFAEFLVALHDLHAGFRDRAAAVKGALRGSDVGFMVVAAPRPGQDDAVQTMVQRLQGEGLSLQAIAANRVAPALAPQGWEKLQAELGRALEHKDAAMLPAAAKVEVQQAAAACFARSAYHHRFVEQMEHMTSATRGVQRFVLPEYEPEQSPLAALATLVPVFEPDCYHQSGHDKPAPCANAGG